MSKNNFFITTEKINEFISHLQKKERAPATIEKYTRDIRNFKDFLNGAEVTKQALVEWSNKLCETYKKASVNAMIVAVNRFCKYCKFKIKKKLLKIQQNTFIPQNKILTYNDYVRLINAAKARNDEQLVLLMETLGSTGIRVSELKYITVEAVRCGLAEVTNKGKTRTVFIIDDLKKVLLPYAKKKGIKSGSIFITRNGKPLDRSNIWRKLKNLSEAAGVEKSKVFTHNFRKIFAVMYYNKSKDIVKLADILGHSNVMTTRIYIMESSARHLKIIKSMKMVI